MKRVFIAAASSAIVRAGLESLLATSPALTVVGDSSRLSLADERDSETLAAQINELRPDVVIAEFEGRVQEELERLFAGASEGEELPATPIVLLTDELPWLTDKRGCPRRGESGAAARVNWRPNHCGG